MIDDWARALSGSADWQACNVLLKTPALKGKQEWVLKCLWQATPDEGARAIARYYSARSFHGICAYIAAHEEYRSIEFVDAFVRGVGELAGKYPEVSEAVDGWSEQRALREKPPSMH